MSSRVLVVHPPVSVARDFIDYPYVANLGAVQLAAVLRARGMAVELVDAFALPASGLAPRSDGRLHLGAPVEDVLARAGAFDTIVVAYGPFHRPPNRDDVLGALLAGLRERTSELILADCYQSGQHYVEADGDAVLASYPEIDAWVKYEAEITVPSVIGTRPRREVHRGREVPDLDTLPTPAWDLVDRAAYHAFHARVVQHLGRGAWAFPIDGRTLPVLTSRGCPFTCAHCSSNPGRAEGAPKTQRRLSVPRMHALFRELRELGATRLEVLDELVNVNERHFEGFLDAIEAADVAFDVPNGMRADYLFERHLRRMRGRVATVSVSAESGVQRVVDQVVGKRLDLAAIVRVAEDAHRADVPLMIHYMVGLPDETAEEVNGTLSFALDLWDRFRAQPAVQFATPLPGTALARGRSLPVVSDWGPLFQTTPSQPDALVDAERLRRFQWSFEQRMAASRSPTVVINATFACNNRCTFCAVPGIARAEPPQGLRELLAQHRGARRLEIDGGEPTMNPELLALVRHARTLGYAEVVVTTNGRMCFYEEFARKLVRSGVTDLRFSVHGRDAQTHALHVGVPEAFEQTIAGIRNCVRFADPLVVLGMNVTVTEDNRDQLDDLVTLAEELGLRAVNLHLLPGVAAAPEIMRAIDRGRERLSLRVHGVPFCAMPGYESFVASYEHGVTFAESAGAHPAPHLAPTRVREPSCAGCAYAPRCGGFSA